jgi:antitoxin component YwqK of YwqJK toxin-antitoxin module
MELIHLPKRILKLVIDNIDTTEDYNNLRLTCKFFHDLLSINKRFVNGKSVEIYTFLQQNIFNQHVIWYENGPIKKNNYYNIEGLKHAYQKEYYENKNIKSKVHYVNGTKTGMHKEFFINGILKSICYYKNGKKVGNEILNNLDGNIRFLKYHKNDTISIKHYLRGKKKTQFQLKNNLLFGICHIYEKNLVSKSCYYIDGLLFGKMQLHNEFGLCEEINYYANEKNGPYIKYNHFGEIIVYANFKYDKLNGMAKMFNYNGINTHMIEFKNGNLHGKYVTNQINKEVFNFKDNKLHGYYYQYYKNSKKHTAIKFHNNKFANIYKKFNKDGSLNIEILFSENGYKIKKHIKDSIYLTFFKFDKEYYYKIGSDLVQLQSCYMNPIFNTYML